MEWALFAAVALAAAVYIALPRHADEGGSDAGADLEELRAEREALLAALRDLDDDAGAERITAEDRASGRRAIGPRLRDVTEQLRDLDEIPR